MIELSKKNALQNAEILQRALFGGNMSNYPNIFIHGLMGYGEEDGADKIFPYWGIGSKNLLRHLREEGYEVYHPSLGPCNSAWDRTCVLWAYLFGGTVDFGKVHSQKYHHARYGHTYPHGVLEDLGQDGPHKKINLFGHSFGGPTVKQAAALFAYGSEEEREGTPPEELSPLFAGGHGSLIHTVTTLSGVNNGTTLATMLGQKGMTFMTYRLLLDNVITADTPISRFYNFQTQQWGIMGEPSSVHGWHFHLPFGRLDGIRAFDSNHGLDNVTHEMQIELVQETVNPSQKTVPSIYYFAQRADCTKDNGKGTRIPDRRYSMFLTRAAGLMTGFYQPKRLSKYGVGNLPWRKNDGFVNLTGQSAPLNAPSAEADYNDSFTPGRWYNMPVEKGDHLLWMGFTGEKNHYFAMYDRMLQLYGRLSDGA